MNRLRVGRGAHVVLVVAPAGYGKTTLVREWDHRDERPFVWCNVRSGDAPADLLRRIATAMPRGGMGAHARLRGPQRSLDEIVAFVGRSLSALEHPVVLVLDEVEHLDDPVANHLLAVLARELPRASQLVLVGRAAPELPLARLRAQGALLEMGVDDLRFSDREAVALLRGAGLALEARVSELNGLLEGWPAGLELAGVALRHGAAPSSVAALPSLVVYFHKQVLPGVPEGDVDLLRRTAPLDRLTPALCDAVLGASDSAERLERLERGGAFVARDGKWYRVHPAFRAFLRDELEATEPHLADIVCSRAAAWYSTRHEVETAMEYAHRADDRDQLATLLEHSLLPFAGGARSDAAARWLDRLDDPALLERRPGTAIVGALTHAMAGRPDAATRWAAAAEHGKLRVRMPDGGASAAPWRALLHAVLNADDVGQMRADAELAVRTLPLGSWWRAVALLALGEARALDGEAVLADDAFAAAQEEALATRNAAVSAVALAERALLASRSADWAHAHVLADAARDAVAQAGLEEHVTSVFAFVASARTALYRGDWPQVRADAQRAEALLPALTEVLGPFALEARVELARLYVALGDEARSLALLDDLDAMLVRLPGLGRVAADVDALRVQLATNGTRGNGSASQLTPAELRLLPLLTTHLSFSEIADRLFVSRNTVKTEAISIYRKLGVTSRADAIERAGARGLIEEGKRQ